MINIKLQVFLLALLISMKKKNRQLKNFQIAYKKTKKIDTKYQKLIGQK
jgi:hypothetical protein